MGLQLLCSFDTFLLAGAPPMLLRVDFMAMGQVARHWRGIAVTLGVSGLVKPFSMAGRPMPPRQAG